MDKNREGMKILDNIEEAERVANIFLNTEKLARVSSRILRHIVLNFLAQQEKKQERQINLRKSGNIDESVEQTQKFEIGRIEEIAMMVENKSRTGEDPKRFQSLIYKILSAQKEQKEHKEKMKIYQTINNFLPKMDALARFMRTNGKIEQSQAISDLFCLSQEKKSIVRESLCSIGAWKIYENKMATDFLKNPGYDSLHIKYTIQTRLLELMIKKKYGEQIRINHLENNVKERAFIVISDSNRQKYIFHIQGEDFQLQKQIDNDDIRDIRSYSNSVIAELGKKGEVASYRCVKGDNGLYNKDILM